jgi:hypothetical protein
MNNFKTLGRNLIMCFLHGLIKHFVKRSGFSTPYTEIAAWYKQYCSTAVSDSQTRTDYIKKFRGKVQNHIKKLQEQETFNTTRSGEADSWSSLFQVFLTVKY